MKRYIIIQKENEKIIDRHIIWELPILKLNFHMLQIHYPKHKFEIYEIAKTIEL
jgi:hypothetical protein